MKKRKTIKIVLLVSAIVIICLAGGMAGAYFGLAKTANSIAAAYQKMAPVHFTEVADGVYRGRAGGFMCSMDINVTVKDHRVAAIDTNNQVNGGGKYRAEGMTERIIEEQSLDVDVVSGATTTSKTIILAVNNALTSK